MGGEGIVRGSKRNLRCKRSVVMNLQNGKAIGNMIWVKIKGNWTEREKKKKVEIQIHLEGH